VITSSESGRLYDRREGKITMDFFSFINSQDIKDHLETLNYQFKTMEANWLVTKVESILLRRRLAPGTG